MVISIFRQLAIVFLPSNIAVSCSISAAQWQKFRIIPGTFLEVVLSIKKQRYHIADKGPSNQSYGFSSSRVWMQELGYKESWAPKNWCFWTMVLDKTWESLGLQGDPTSPSWRRSVLGVHWREWCWSWNSNTLATWCEELTHLKRPWCWERLRAGGEGDDRGWDGWMAPPTQWTWVWVHPGSWWWTGRAGMLQFKGSQRVRHNRATEPQWVENALRNCPSSPHKPFLGEQ